ncbi:hypothetical protein RJ640_025459 [Escallonia rubra]|uniref:Phytosulfokine n=1 Tax=Escallonia rubra TaxID=112253 RepID=A0AA88RHQ2_9ASTE|nr:hypothetical protein RJ640_025459 [Escallonia rubra]
MKKHFHGFALLFFLFIITSQTYARSLAIRKGDKMVKPIKSTEESAAEFETSDFLDNLLGVEDCGNGEQECLNRRVIAEAHLDYIYTQHRKP